jgi:hypothetical protein
VRRARTESLGLLVALCGCMVDPTGDGLAGFGDGSAADSETDAAPDESSSGGDPEPPGTDSSPGAEPHPVDDDDGDESSGEPTEDPDDCEVSRYHLDLDGDGFGDADDFIDACAPMGSYDALDDTDCCDLDADVNGDQEAFFGEPSLCGSFDFDCDGVEIPEVDECGALGCTTSWSLCPEPECGVESSMTAETCPEPEPGLPPPPGTVANVIATQHCR